MENKNKQSFETTTFHLALAIICYGIPLEEVKRDSNGKSIFIFPQTPHLKQLIQLFWDRELRVEPNAYWEAQRYLKSRIYGG